MLSCVVLLCVLLFFSFGARVRCVTSFLFLCPFVRRAFVSSSFLFLLFVVVLVGWLLDKWLFLLVGCLINLPGARVEEGR